MSGSTAAGSEPKRQLGGVLAVFQTPFREDESIDFDTLRREIDCFLRICLKIKEEAAGSLLVQQLDHLPSPLAIRPSNPIRPSPRMALSSHFGSDATERQFLSAHRGHDTAPHQG